MTFPEAEDWEEEEDARENKPPDGLRSSTSAILACCLSEAQQPMLPGKEKIEKLVEFER